MFEVIKMSKFAVVRNTISESTQFDVEQKCHKLRKSSGKILYKITKDSNGLSLSIEDIAATQPDYANENVAGSVVENFDLTNILNVLQVGTVAGSANKLLPFIADSKNAVFVTAVLVHLGLVRIH